MPGSLGSAVYHSLVLISVCTQERCILSLLLLFFKHLISVMFRCSKICWRGFSEKYFLLVKPLFANFNLEHLALGAWDMHSTWSPAPPHVFEYCFWCVCRVVSEFNALYSSCWRSNNKGMIENMFLIFRQVLNLFCDFVRWRLRWVCEHQGCIDLCSCFQISLGNLFCLMTSYLRAKGWSIH